VSILRLTDGKERLLLSVHDLWQHERLLIDQMSGGKMMMIVSCLPVLLLLLRPELIQLHISQLQLRTLAAVMR
jgi:hypothetical protein